MSGIQLQYLGTLSEYNTITLKYGHKFNIIVLGQPYLYVCPSIIRFGGEFHCSERTHLVSAGEQNSIK